MCCSPFVFFVARRLNEGFASWAENWAADKLFPEYHMWDQFTTGHLTAALRLDALKSSHPIQVPICHAEEVDQVFDAISYCKGGSVVRMIKAVLGMKHFLFDPVRWRSRAGGARWTVSAERCPQRRSAPECLDTPSIGKIFEEDEAGRNGPVHAP